MLDLRSLSFPWMPPKLSVKRRQAATLLQAAGYPPEILQVVESLCFFGEVRMRYAGAIVSETPFRVQSGVHQGCPLFVLCPNTTLGPLWRKFQEDAGIRFAIVFADDINTETIPPGRNSGLRKKKPKLRKYEVKKVTKEMSERYASRRDITLLVSMYLVLLVFLHTCDSDVVDVVCRALDVL